MRPRSVTVVAAALALFMVGCFRLPSDDGSADQPTPSTGRPAPGGTGESLEGRFSYETMDEYVNAITPMISQWFADDLRGVPMPRRVLYIPHGAGSPENCADGSGQAAMATSTSYEYCGVDEVVYVGQDMLWEFYTRTGDAGPAVGLAHEFGHHIQQQMGVPSPRTAADSIRHENQADCAAGAWTRYTDERGWLEYPDDIEDIDELFPLIGSAEGAGRDHGTPGERARAFQHGFDGGLSACNDFYPSTPLAPAA